MRFVIVNIIRVVISDSDSLVTETNWSAKQHYIVSIKKGIAMTVILYIFVCGCFVFSSKISNRCINKAFF